MLVFWQKRLDELREQQGPFREERPALQIPLPPPPGPELEPEEDTHSPVIIIDL